MGKNVITGYGRQLNWSYTILPVGMGLLASWMIFFCDKQPLETINFLHTHLPFFVSATIPPFTWMESLPNTFHYPLGTVLPEDLSLRASVYMRICIALLILYIGAIAITLWKVLNKPVLAMDFGKVGKYPVLATGLLICHLPFVYIFIFLRLSFLIVALSSLSKIILGILHISKLDISVQFLDMTFPLVFFFIMLLAALSACIFVMNLIRSIYAKNAVGLEIQDKPPSFADPEIGHVPTVGAHNLKKILLHIILFLTIASVLLAAANFFSGYARTETVNHICSFVPESFKQRVLIFLGVSDFIPPSEMANGHHADPSIPNRAVLNAILSIVVLLFSFISLIVSTCGFGIKLRNAADRTNTPATIQRPYPRGSFMILSLFWLPIFVSMLGFSLLVSNLSHVLLRLVFGVPTLADSVRHALFTPTFLVLVLVVFMLHSISTWHLSPPGMLKNMLSRFYNGEV